MGGGDVLLALSQLRSNQHDTEPLGRFPRGWLKARTVEGLAGCRSVSGLERIFVLCLVGLRSQSSALEPTSLGTPALGTSWLGVRGHVVASESAMLRSSLVVVDRGTQRLPFRVTQGFSPHFVFGWLRRRRSIAILSRATAVPGLPIWSSASSTRVACRAVSGSDRSVRVATSARKTMSDR